MLLEDTGKCSLHCSMTTRIQVSESWPQPHICHTKHRQSQHSLPLVIDGRRRGKARTYALRPIASGRDAPSVAAGVSQRITRRTARFASHGYGCKGDESGEDSGEFKVHQDEARMRIRMIRE